VDPPGQRAKALPGRDPTRPQGQGSPSPPAVREDFKPNQEIGWGVEKFYDAKIQGQESVSTLEIDGDVEKFYDAKIQGQEEEVESFALPSREKDDSLALPFMSTSSSSQEDDSFALPSHAEVRQANLEEALVGPGKLIKGHETLDGDRCLLGSGTTEPIDVSQHQKIQGQHFTVYFANYTAWGTKAEGCFFQEKLQGFDIHCGVEHHLEGQKLKVARAKIQKAGWRTFISPATLTGRGGNSGGAWILTRRGLAAKSGTTHLERGGNQWTASIIRFKGRDVAFISIYLQPHTGGLGLDNLGKLEEVIGYIGSLKIQFIIVGDWNCEPKQLEEESHILRYLKAKVLTPENVAFTCNQGSGRMIDYMIASPGICHCLRITADLDGPWTPHLGLIIKLNMDPISIMGRQHRSPVVIPTCPGPDRMTWQEHMGQAGVEPHADMYHPVDPRSTDLELTKSFSRWSRAAEGCLLGRTSMSEDEARKCRGRGQAPRYEIKAVLPPNKVGAHLANPDGNFWGMLKVRLQELV
jgi:hypothetical protein